MPQVLCELPPHPVAFKTEWDHLAGVRLTDPGYGSPGRIDLLLGVVIFVNMVLTGLWYGEAGTPTSFETHFGWFLAGPVQGSMIAKKKHMSSFHL